MQIFLDTADVKEIRELNVGAYVVLAKQIWPVLDFLQPSPQDGEFRLTEKSGHFIQRDRPELVIQAIRDVIRDVRPRSEH